MAKIFSIDEVSDHNSLNDCWLVIAGKVYDVTKFLQDHPGGEEVLLASTGKDGTHDFEDIGHSATAKAMMDEYYIGEINTSTIPNNRAYVAPKHPHYNHHKTTHFIRFLLPFIILALAVALRFYSKTPST